MKNNHPAKIIVAQNVIKKFDNFTAVRGVSFVVSQGECFGILGPNGAGKTSLVRMICGFSPATYGELRVFGKEVMGNLRQIKAKVGLVPQEDNLDLELSVWENLLVYASYFRLRRKLAQERAEAILHMMDLKDKAKVSVENLSGGMKRRLVLGRALINQPELLILDEPTTGLDPYARHLLWQRLRKLKEAGTTMLLTTHYLEEASQLCDRLIIMHRGRVLEEDAPQSLVQRHVGSWVVELGVQPGDRELILSSVTNLITGYYDLGDNLLLFTNFGRKLAEGISALVRQQKLKLFHQLLRPSNLEDVFLKLTGETMENSNLI